MARACISMHAPAVARVEARAPAKARWRALAGLGTGPANNPGRWARQRPRPLVAPDLVRPVAPWSRGRPATGLALSQAGGRSLRAAATWSHLGRCDQGGEVTPPKGGVDRQRPHQCRTIMVRPGGVR